MYKALKKTLSIIRYRASATVVTAPIFPKKDLGGASGEGVYIRQEPFVQMASKCFPMEQFLYRINYRFSWALPKTAFRNSKKLGFLRHFEIYQICFWHRYLYYITTLKISIGNRPPANSFKFILVQLLHNDARE